MSRYAQRDGAISASKATGASSDGLTASSDDICPVCKSSRYMNPNMRFLVNPECYHRMCSSCVDRIFAAGRAKCPIAKCPKMLRKAGFRKQIFEDVQMEREKDIRQEITEVFNRREDEFETLRDYNDYLEEVENISFGLINGIDVEENRRKLDKYKEANTADIRANKSFAQDAEARWAAKQAQEKEQAKLRREAARRQEEEQRREEEEGKRRIVDDIAKGKGDAAAIARAGEERLRKSKLRRADMERHDPQPQVSTSDEAFVIRGLKKRTQPEPEKPYDPFGGLTFQMDHVKLTDNYDLQWLTDARNDPLVAAGGYDIPGYCAHALTGAFAGLGVFIGDNMAQQTDS